MLTDTKRKMASIQKISKLEPIPNSDFLEVAMMENLGWKVVVKKGEFEVGRTVIYLEIDSAINVKDLLPSMQFLADKGIRKLFTGRTPEASAFSEEYVRIKTIKLRGQVSQGLILPLSVLNEIPFERFKREDGSVPCMTFDGGEDMTPYFKIEVWDRLVEWYEDRSQLGPKAGSCSAGSFPSWAPKTDETRIESLMEYFDDPEMVEAQWECTEKNDGSSETIFYCPLKWPTDPLRFSTRNFILKTEKSPDWVGIFDLEDLKTRLGDLFLGKDIGTSEKLAGHELAIQGEHIGPKFNGNRDRNTQDHFRVFRIFDVTTQEFLSPTDRYLVTAWLRLEHVKVLETCQIFKKLHSIEDFEKYVDRKSDNGNQIEGVVFKRIDNGRISFKKVSSKYLLKTDS